MRPRSITARARVVFGSLLFVLLTIGFTGQSSADNWNNRWPDNNQSQGWEPKPKDSTQNQNYQVPYSAKTIINITDDVKLPAAKRVGVNIGAYDQYGSGQYMRNLIPNPGFEPAEMAMLFLVGNGSNATRVQPNRWEGMYYPRAHPDGFWDGATYEFMTGPATGKTGTIKSFATENGLYTFYLDGNQVAPNFKDVMVVRQKIDGYYTETPTQHHFPEPNDRRPGSPGVQALRLKSSGWNPSLAIPFDSFARDADSSAGKMNIVEGLWSFELWVKPTTANQTVEIKFLRHREAIFFQETFPLQQGWQKIERKFYVEPGVDALIPYDVNPLAFEVRVASDNGDILVDDAEIARIDNRWDTAFSDRFVELLRELQPGVIRNWGHQLGNSLDNQLAEQWARRTNDFDPRDPRPVKFHYSIHEFLELAQVVNAEPWYVIPPTWSSGELQNFIAYLSAPAGTHPYADKRAAMGQVQPWTDVFTKIHLEMGNEMWGGNTTGDPFAGATLWDGYHVGEFGNQRFSIMRSSNHFRADRMNLILGGQAGFPERQMEIQASSSSHDSIGVAPYFASHISVFGNESDLLRSVFARPTQQVSPHGKMYRSTGFAQANSRNTELAIYEIHSHLTHGSMPTAQRNKFLSGLNMGILLPLHMLTYQAELGVRNQAAFTATQYSWEMPGKGGDRVKLWGLLRDSEAAGIKRPTWLGMELVNSAIRGDFLMVDQSQQNPGWKQKPVNEITQEIEVPYIHTFAFKSWGQGYSVVIFNLDLHSERTVDLNLPFSPSGSANIETLTSNYIFDNNEEKVNVETTTQQYYIGQKHSLQLPKHSITVITWDK